jgi:hypothetical protein
MTHAEAVRSSATERYLLEEMSEIERHAFEDHYFDCTECAEDVRAGALMREGVRAGLLERSNVRSIGDAAPRSTPARRGWPPPTFLPWAAAAALALVVGYQSLPQPPGASRELTTQALTPVTLRPASRAAEPVLLLSVDSSAITLAVELGAPVDSDVSYDLRTTGGHSVASGHTAPPPAGAPLLLLLPAWTLSPDEHYILTVHRAADRQLIDEYRFAVSRR